MGKFSINEDGWMISMSDFRDDIHSKAATGNFIAFLYHLIGEVEQEDDQQWTATVEELRNG